MKTLRALVLLALVSQLFGQNGFNATRQFSAVAVSNDIGLQENGAILYHKVSWVVTGTPGGCTVAIDSSADGSSWSVGGIIAGQTCTSSGNSVVTSASANFVRINLTAFSGGSSPTITVNYTGWASNPAGGGGSGTVNNCATVGGNAYYAASGTAANCDATIIDNGTGTLTLVGLNTASNGALTIAPNGTGAAIFNAGTSTNPAIQTTGMAANTGMFSVSATNFCWDSVGTVVACNVPTGFTLNATGAFGFAQSGGGNGAAGVTLKQIGGTTTGAFDITQGSSTGLINTNNKCTVLADVTLAINPTFTAICTFTLPNTSKSWGLQCNGTYSITAGTTPTLQLGYIIAQAPTGVIMNGQISNITAGTTIVETNNRVSGGASTAQQTIITGAVVTTVTDAFWSAFGVINLGSATSGTFILNASMGGTTPAGVIRAGSTCYLY